VDSSKVIADLTASFDALSDSAKQAAIEAAGGQEDWDRLLKDFENLGKEARETSPEI
jgi:hypothetical protein